MASPILDLGPCNSSCAWAIDSTDNFRTCAAYVTTLAGNKQSCTWALQLAFARGTKGVGGGGGGGGGGVTVASLTLRQLVWVCDKVILYCV